MHRSSALWMSSIAYAPLFLVLGCSGESGDAGGNGAAAGKGGAGGGSGESGSSGEGGSSGGNAGTSGAGFGGAAGGSVGGTAGSGGAGGTGGSAGTGGSSGSGATFCARWQALGPGALPGFATDSVCNDYTEIRPGDVPCTGAPSPSATLSEVLLGQNHLLRPTTEDYTQNDSGNALASNAVRPKFRLVSHRPALLMVSVTGSGAAPDVKVTGRRRGAELGSFCLKGPASLSSGVPAEPSFADWFTVSLPADWIRTGLELEIQAGNSTRAIPSPELRVAGGLRHIVVEGSMMMYGDTTLHFVPKDRPDTYVMADELPVQSLVWAHFPVPVVFDPFTMSGRSGRPPRVLTAREGDFDEVGEVLDVFSEIRRANGHQGETSYFAALDSSGWGGGLGGGNGAAGPNSQLMIRHEGGHAYGLPHLEDAYREGRYPFAKRTDGTGCVLGVSGEDGCGVGPFWKYFQSRQVFESPWENQAGGVYKRDPMAGGGNNWFGSYTDQWVLDYMQNRVFWDDERSVYVRYDSSSGEFVPDTDVDDENWYGRPAERDVPVYTIFGSYSASTSAVNVIQPPLHYRGHLLRTMDPTNNADLDWLKDNRGRVCNGGCDFVVRVTFGGSVKNYLLNEASGEYVRWAVNVRDQGAITKIELFRRPTRNDNGGNIGAATAENFFDAAALVATRTL